MWKRAKVAGEFGGEKNVNQYIETCYNHQLDILLSTAIKMR